MNGLSEANSMELIRKMMREICLVTEANARLASDLASLMEDNAKEYKSNLAHAESNVQTAQQNRMIAQRLNRLSLASRQFSNLDPKPTVALAMEIERTAESIYNKGPSSERTNYRQAGYNAKQSALSAQSSRPNGRAVPVWGENADNDLMLHAALCGNVDVDIINDYQAVYKAMCQNGWNFTVDEIKARWKNHVFPKIAAARLSAEAARERAKKDDESDDEYYHYRREMVANPLTRDDFPLEPLPKKNPDDQDDGYRLPATTYDPYRDDEAYRRPFKSRAEVKGVSVKDAPAVASKSDTVDHTVAEEVPGNEVSMETAATLRARKHFGKIHGNDTITKTIGIIKPWPVDTKNVPKGEPAFTIQFKEVPIHTGGRTKAAGTSSSGPTTKQGDQQDRSSLTPLGDSKFSYETKARSEGDVPRSSDSTESVCGSCDRHSAKLNDGGDVFEFPDNYNTENRSQKKGKGKVVAVKKERKPHVCVGPSPLVKPQPSVMIKGYNPGVREQIRLKMAEVEAKKAKDDIREKTNSIRQTTAVLAAQNDKREKWLAEREKIRVMVKQYTDELEVKVNREIEQEKQEKANKEKQEKADKEKQEKANKEQEHVSHLSDESSFASCGEGEEQQH
ncbi:hypothetical protein F4809DRAFT_662015 [Biscogniauxia mediterranea]|nr:hypothetical protein F4809DRAFT_662015 [Biscogniauxia mediterranea]